MSVTFNFSAKSVVVTGSSTGIGEAIAKKFIGAGASVVLTGRDKSSLERVKAECGNLPGKVEICAGNIKEREVRKSIIETAISKFGKLDIVVNNAGIAIAGKVPYTDEEMKEYDEIMEINVRSILSLNAIAVPHLIASKGNIVNISSVCGLRALPARHFYCMSKAALDMHTQALSSELGPLGVRVNSINPGTIKTQIQLRAGATPEEVAKLYKKRASMTPAQRCGEPEEIADAVCFVASDAAAYITGQLIAVDGGYYTGAGFVVPKETE